MRERGIVSGSIVLVVLIAAAGFGQTEALVEREALQRRDYLQHRAPLAAVRDYAIIQFQDPPAASYLGGIEGLARTKPEVGRFDPGSVAVQAYLRHLSQGHDAYRRWLDGLGNETGIAPEIVREFTITFNGVAIRLGGASPEDLAKGPGASAWAYSRLYRPGVSIDVDLIKAVDVWPGLGGAGNAGAGIRVGVIDSGIDETHPFFSCKGSISHKIYVSGDAPGDRRSALVLDHGTHVAGTIAGCSIREETAGTLSGVAPGAHLWDYNVFPGYGLGFDSFEGAALAHDVVAALEDAVLDGMDVVNLSLQGRVQRARDFLAEAVNSTVDAGIVVAVAAGNSGPGIATMQSPGGAAKALTAGATTAGHVIGLPVAVSGEDGTQAFFAASGDFDSLTGAPFSGQALVNWADTGGAVTACNAITNTASIAGSIALIADGGCSFTTKIRNAEAAGAAGVIVYSNMSGPPLSMRHDGSDPFPTISAVMVSSADGAAILDSLPARAEIELGVRGQHLATPDIVAAFSSRGPSPFEYLIKPDVMAPGVNVRSSVLGGRYAAFHGTSVAASHLSGAAAVLRQLHPDWSAQDIKSAIVNTAAPVATADRSAATALFSRGSGRVDLFAAAHTPLTVAPVSASFGFWNGDREVRGVRDLKLKNVTDEELSCSVSQTGSPLVAASTYSISLAPRSSGTVSLDLDAGAARATASGDYSGEIYLLCGDATLRVPWWVGIDRDSSSIAGDLEPRGTDPTKCADLVVTDFTITPTMPIENQNARIDIRVLNQGTCASLSFLVQWRSSQFAPTGPTDFILGLPAGASTIASFQYAFPEAGNFTTVATVDSDNTVEEFNESNNIAIVPVTVLREGIDLLISDFKVEPAPGVDASIPPNPVQGRLTRATITVRNQGNRSAGDFVLRWIPGLFVPALSTQINGLAPGASTTRTFDFTYSTARETTTSAMADSTFRVAEVDETNNSQAIPVTVEAQRADLQVTSLSINPGQPVRGIGATVTAVVRNRGNTAASNFILEWRPSPLGAPLARQINGLGVGQSTVVNFDYTYSFVGTFNSTATVDRSNTVLELDEDNNTRTLTVQVLQDTVDLQIIDMDIRGAGGKGQAPPCEREPRIVEPILIQGQRVDICITIRNNGNAPSDSFVVEWNPDALGLITPSPGTLVTQIDTVGPFQTVELPLTFIYNVAGNFRTVARVDAFDNVDETNENNQLFLVNVVVEPAPIDLRITEFVILPTSPIRASKATARITVKNFGPFPTESFFVRWKPTGEEAGGGLLAQVVGLNALGQPDDSATVELESTFFVAGPYTSFAEVDTFDQIIESNENNNTATRFVNVQPRMTTLRVDFTNVKVFQGFEDGLDGNGEWKMLFAVLDPNSSCHTTIDLDIADVPIDVDGIQCQQFSDGSVEDGDNLHPNRSFEVTLLESFPLVLAAIAAEADPLSAPELPGFVIQFWSSADYRGVGTLTVPGTEGECGGGHCYDLTYDVSIVSEPPVPFLGTGNGPEMEMNQLIEPNLPLMLPDGLAQLLPLGLELPDELTRNPDEYWDFDRYIQLLIDGFESGDLSGWSVVSGSNP